MHFKKFPAKSFECPESFGLGYDQFFLKEFQGLLLIELLPVQIITTFEPKRVEWAITFMRAPKEWHNCLGYITTVHYQHKG